MRQSPGVGVSLRSVNQEEAAKPLHTHVSSTYSSVLRLPASFIPGSLIQRSEHQPLRPRSLEALSARVRVTRGVIVFACFCAVCTSCFLLSSLLLPLRRICVRRCICTHHRSSSHSRSRSSLLEYIPRDPLLGSHFWQCAVKGCAMRSLALVRGWGSTVSCAESW